MGTRIWGGDLPQLQCWWQRLLHVGVQEPPVSYAHQPSIHTPEVNETSRTEKKRKLYGFQGSYEASRGGSPEYKTCNPSPLQRAQDDVCASDPTCLLDKSNLPCMRVKMWHTMLSSLVCVTQSVICFSAIPHSIDDALILGTPCRLQGKGLAVDVMQEQYKVLCRGSTQCDAGAARKADL